MATSNPGFGNFKLVEGNPNIRSYPKKTSVAVSPGDPLKLSAGKLMNLHTTTTTTWSDYGVVAAGKATSTGSGKSTSVPCYVMTEGQIWEISGTSSTTYSTNYTLGKQNVINITTNNSAPKIAKVKKSGTNAKAPVIVGWKGGDGSASGDRILVKFPVNILTHS